MTPPPSLRDIYRAERSRRIAAERENVNLRRENASLRKECRRLKRELREARYVSTSAVAADRSVSPWVALPWHGYVS